jgi:hypothetical protein
VFFFVFSFSFFFVEINFNPSKKIFTMGTVQRRSGAGAQESVEHRAKSSVFAVLFNTFFAVPLAFFSALNTSGAASVRLVSTMTRTMA